MSFIRHRRATSPNKFECRNVYSTNRIDVYRLIRLLNVQMKDCFNLYILNNMDGGRNGFLPVKRDEKNILISLSDLVNLFQNKNGKLASIIHDKRLFLMAMIPFLRGYIHIMNDPEDLYGQCEPIRVDDYTGKKMTFFHDPDGLPLELHE